MNETYEKIRVLDDGFVRLVDVMGDDAAACQAARISYGEGTRSVSDDRNLIRYMMRHGHTSPFEQCELKFHVRVPMDCWRQWIRHRTASVNEYSTRYSIAIDSAQKTLPVEWRRQSQDNNQGSGEYLDEDTGSLLTRGEADFQERARHVYETRIEAGVSREQARKELPLSTYTEAYWKCNLHNLLHFLRLRLDPHAQLEIRLYAQAITSIVKNLFPLTWEAFVDYRLESLTLSRPEVEAIAGRSVEGMGVREGKELREKCVRLGILDPTLERVDRPKRTLRLIGISGPAGSGKDTVARMISDLVPGTQAVAQADPLKRFCAEVFGWGPDRLWGPSERRAEEDPDGLTARAALQLLGTEWGRALREDVWIDLALRSISPRASAALITDVRFPNEARKIREAGGVVWMVAGRCAGLSGHESEAHWHNPELLCLVSEEIDNSGTLEYTNRQVEQLLNKK